MATIDGYRQSFQFKAARAIKGLRQEEAAKLIGVSASTLSSWENGETEPLTSQFIRMSIVYGVPMEQLCGTKSFV